MRENKAVLKHGACLATIDLDEKWVRTVAREVDIESEMDVAWALWDIMRHFQRTLDFAGIASNNIYWETTETPIRMLCVPHEGDFVTVINPKYEKLAGQSVDSTERCGSIPKRSFVVKRKTLVEISGYDMDGEQIKLEFGSKRGEGPNCDSWVIQHEMDHLDGVLIMDKAVY